MSPAEARIELWRARTGPKRHCRGKSAYRLNNFPGLPDCHWHRSLEGHPEKKSGRPVQTRPLGRILLRCMAGMHLSSEEHTSELQSLMRNSYAVFCLKKKTIQEHNQKQ